MLTVEVSARIGALIVGAAEAAGANGRSLAAELGFDPAIAADPDARIPLSLETALWEEAARRGGDPAFGLHAAERLEPGTFDVLDYAVRTAPTVRVAVERLARYNRLEHGAAVYSMIDTDGVLRIEHTLVVPGAVQSRHAAEFTLAAIVVIGGQIAGQPVRPRAVELRHEPPASVGEAVRLFGVAPRFGAAVNAIELDEATAALPVPAADPALWRVIERQAEMLLASYPDPSETTAQRLRRELVRVMAGGEVSLAAVAARLRMSARTLQRRLAGENVTFDGVLDELRRELALRYLADPRVGIAEIAYLLGYSEPSAFHRAFKRWTGTTPAAARPAAAIDG